MEAIASSGMPVLVKPFLADELIQLINRLCRSSESSALNRSAPVADVGLMDGLLR
jgi:hypothetical protein